MIDPTVRKYFPKVYDDVLEINELSATENATLAEANANVEDVINNEFVVTANSKGLEKWEKLLNIVANPATETIEFRRERIINRFSMSQPFTKITLRNQLDILLGEGEYELDIVYNDYLVELVAHTGVFGKLDELLRTLFIMLPANMEMDVTNVLIDDLPKTLYMAAVADTAFEYTLTCDVNLGYTLQNPEKVASVVDSAFELTLTNDVVETLALEGVTKMGSKADTAFEYELS